MKPIDEHRIELRIRLRWKHENDARIRELSDIIRGEGGNGKQA